MSRWLVAVLWLAVIGTVVYCTSLFNPFIWDDEQFIYRNSFVTQFQLPQLLTESITSGAGEVSNYYRPLTSLSFAVDYAIWGMRPFGFHLTNTLLHLGAGLFLYFVLRQLSNSPAHPPVFWQEWQWWIALFFLIHPVQTEAVSYINSRGDSLYVFLLMTSILSVLLWWQKKRPPLPSLLSDLITPHLQIVLLCTSIITFTLSIFAKELGILGAALLPLTVLTFEAQRHASLRKSVLFLLKKWWLWLLVWSIAAAYLLLRATSLNFQNSFNFYDHTENIYGQSLSVRLGTFSRVFWTYQQVLLLPFPLHMERSINLEQSILNWWTVATLSFLGVIVSCGWYERHRHKTVWIWFGLLWYLICLLPVSGIIAINGVLYEHWLYLPIVGWLVVGWRTSMLVLPKAPLSWKIIGITFLATIYSFLTIRQNYLWGNVIRFYTYTLQFNQTPRLWNNLGMAYADQHQYQQALTAYQQAIDHGGSDYSQIHHNIGNTQERLGNKTAAQAAYERAIAINPDFYFSYPALINIYMSSQQYQPAKPLLEQYLVYQPHDPTALFLYGKTLWYLNDQAAAKIQFNAAIKASGFQSQLKAAITEVLTSTASASPTVSPAKKSK